jgi:hypothetical protein
MRPSDYFLLVRHVYLLGLGLAYPAWRRIDGATGDAPRAETRAKPS